MILWFIIVQIRNDGLLVASAVIRKYKRMFVHGYQKNGKQLFLLRKNKKHDLLAVVFYICHHIFFRLLTNYIMNAYNISKDKNESFMWINACVVPLFLTQFHILSDKTLYVPLFVLSFQMFDYIFICILVKF